MEDRAVRAEKTLSHVFAYGFEENSFTLQLYMPAPPSLVLMRDRSQDTQRPEEIEQQRPKGPERNWIHGTRLYIITASLLLAIFLVSLEISIVATSLVNITNEFGDLDRSSWIVTGYLITYTGFLIIFAKISDIFGRKPIVIISLILFVLFSGGCGAAQNITQLIILRTMQGIGGAGSYSLLVIIFFEIVPPPKFAAFTSMISGVFALAFLLGPIVGGVINENTTWRWVFLINVPAGALATGVLFLSLPAGFPNHTLPVKIFNPTPLKGIFSREQLKRLDFPGVALLLCGSILLVAVLEEADVHFPWNSAFVIAGLIISALAWIGFFAWSRYVTTKEGIREPVFPWRFMQRRASVAMILTMLLNGAPFTMAIIELPLRLQTVNQSTPLQAGLRLLPFALVSPIGSTLSPILAKKLQIPPIFVLLTGSILQIVGSTLLSLPLEDPLSLPVKFYIFQAILGFGIGINLATVIAMTPFVVEPRDRAVALSAMVQFRFLGGAIGLAVATVILNSHLKSALAASFAPETVIALTKSASAIAQLSPSDSVLARVIYSDAFRIQFRAVAIISAAQIPAALGLWKRPQIRIK